jgi:hypothetical protein
MRGKDILQTVSGIILTVSIISRIFGSLRLHLKCKIWTTTIQSIKFGHGKTQSCYIG